MTLSARNIRLTLGGRAVVSDVSLDVAPGSITAILGPNGAGKSSLLRVLSGESQPSSGTVLMDNQDIATLGIASQARQRSVMAQSNLLAFDFLVEEVLAMGWVRAGGETLREPLNRVAEQCSVGHFFGRRFGSLSGGERQRVHFARTLLQVWPYLESTHSEHDSSGYMLLDEPTAGLDLKHELSILRLARQARDARLGIVIVLHDLNLASRFADRLVLMHEGRVVAQGPPPCVLHEHTLKKVYQTPILVEYHERLARIVVHTQ